MSSVLRRASILLLLCLPAVTLAQAYTSVLVFGDSLSDTGNVAHLTGSQYNVRIPGPLSGYTDGRFTDGKDTAPAATNYTGVWIEQLAATFPASPAVIASLDGGTNYAYGFAFTGTGTSPLNLTTGITVNVDNIGQQVTDYLTAHPTVPANTLVVVWGGANDVINATSATDITTAVSGELTAIQRLIGAGATDLLIANLPPLGAVPRFNMSASSATATAGAQAFNTGLAAGLASLPAANPGVTLNLKAFDVYSLFNSVIASPSTNGLINVTGKSQGDLTVNPDRYFFWDDLHPTTAVHHLLAVAAAALVAPPSPSISATLAPSSVTVRSGSTATSTLTVTPAGGFSGSVSITCGSLPANATCNPGDTPPVSFSTPQNFTVTINTNGKTSPTPAGLLPVALTGAGLSVAALALLSLALLRLGPRAGHLPPALLAVLAAAALTSLLGLSGCGGTSHNTPTGTYTIPITVTPSTGSATTATLTLIVQ